MKVRVLWRAWENLRVLIQYIKQNKKSWYSIININDEKITQVFRFSRHTLRGRTDETLEGQRGVERFLVWDLLVGKPLMVREAVLWSRVWKVGANLGGREREERERKKMERRSKGREYWEGAMKLNGESGTLYYPTRLERERERGAERCVTKYVLF